MFVVLVCVMLFDNDDSTSSLSTPSNDGDEVVLAELLKEEVFV